MKKRRFSIMALAAVAALASAFATKPCFQCEHMPQYRFYNGQYVPAGEFGLDFDCDEEISSTCTYYKPIAGQPVYNACRSGVYNDWSGRAQK